MANINDEFDFNATFAGGSQIKDRQIKRIMRGLRAAKRDVGPSIARNLIHIWGTLLVVAILLFGGMFTFFYAAVGLMDAGDWLLGGKTATNFITWYVMPWVMVLSFLGLVWLFYWRSRSDSSGI